MNALKYTFLSTAIWLIFITSLLIKIHRSGGGVKLAFDTQTLFAISASVLCTFSCILLIQIGLKNSFRKIVIVSFSFVFSIMFFYLRRSQSPFTFDLVGNNLDAFTSWESLKIVVDLFHETYFASDLFWSIVFSLGVLLIEFKIPLDTAKVKKKQLILTLCLGTILSTALLTKFTYDPISQLLRSTAHHFREPKKFHGKLTLPRKHASLPETKTSHFAGTKKPHLFLILLESYSSRFVNQFSESGIEYTPTMNALAKDHLFFKNYFSNSIQTAKGHFAAICGQIPITKGIEFKKSACFEKQCAPGLLKHAGYRSLFFQADPNLDYDGSRNFLLKKAKFDDVPQIVGPRKADGERFYGFGIRDSAFYKRFFSRLKELDATTPHFFTLATVANHLPFTFLAPEENEVYPNPATFKQRYLNSLRLSDKDLAVFFDEFKRSQFFENSIVFATGDHSYPTGEHNSNHNSDFAFQENFGVPLLIVDNRQVLTKKNYSNLQNNHFSHLNLAPTFLDLAGAHHYEEFIAESIFSPTNSQNEPIYLIQPYMGGLQAVIKYPYKIIYEEFTGNKTFYDLSKDPNEMDPLNLKTDSPEYQELTGEIEFIQHRQAAFQCAP